MRPATSLLCATAALALAGCASAPLPPAGALPTPFVLERDLAGDSIARGQFAAITGARRGFTAHLHGTMQGEVFVLTEQFAFDDGERDTKTWRLRRTGPGLWEGTREDVIGPARARQDGNLLRMEYDVRLGGGGGRIVHFRDVLALVPAGVGNAASVGWHGLRVATVRLQITRDGSSSAPGQAGAL